MALASVDFNRPYRKQERCIALDPNLTADPPVRYPDGELVGPGYDVPRDPHWDPHTTVHSACVGQPGHVRIDMSETVELDSGLLYFHKGGQGYEPPSVPYGHVEAAVLRHPGPPVFTKDVLDKHGAEPRNRNGHGAGRAAPVTGVRYQVKPLPIGPDDADNAWLYKDPAHYPGKNLGGARYSKYGEAGPTQGAGDESFAYLCWSWVRQAGLTGDPRDEVSGGGAIRALLRPGELVERCDVKSITAPAWNRRGDTVGQVIVIYVRVPAGHTALYGWIVHSHLTPGRRGWDRTLHVTRPRGP